MPTLIKGGNRYGEEECWYIGFDDGVEESLRNLAQCSSASLTKARVNCVIQA